MNRQRGFTILLYLLAGLAVLAVLTGIAYKIRESGKDAVKLEWAAANEAQRQREAKQAAAAEIKKEKGDAKAKVVYRTITKQIDRYIDRPIYRNVCLDTDGLRDANAALRGPDAPAPKPDKPVPGFKPIGGWDGGERVAEADRSVGIVLRLSAEAPGAR